jgi:hypothetical protein
VGIAAALRRLLPIVAVVVAVAGTFAPWGYSGERGRNSYQLVQAVVRLGIFDSGLTANLIRAWLVTPLVLAVALSLALVRPRWATIPVALCLVMSLLLALAIRRSPQTLGFGAPTTIAALAMALCGVLVAPRRAIWKDTSAR